MLSKKSQTSLPPLFHSHTTSSIKLASIYTLSHFHGFFVALFGIEILSNFSAVTELS